MKEVIKPLPACFLIHANAQYAEIHPDQFGQVVEKSYLPTLDIFLRNPYIRAVMDFSGYTLEVLKKDYPVVIDKLGQLISQGTVEMCGSTYSNPMLPQIPLENAKRQINAFEEIYHDLFGGLGVKPTGFFPHEYFIDAPIVHLLDQLDYKWVPVWGTHYHNSKEGPMNNYLPGGAKPKDNHGRSPNFKKEMELIEPFQIIGALDSSITGIIVNAVKDLLHHYHDKKLPLKGYFKRLHRLNVEQNKSGGLAFLGPSDLEFIGYWTPIHDNRKSRPIDPVWLEDFCQEARNSEAVTFQNPSDHLSLHPPKEQLYLKCGGDVPTLDIWSKDPDNKRLNLICDDINQKIGLAQIKLGLIPPGQALEDAKKILEEALKERMFAESGDGRGWNPLVERRLFCYDHGVTALNLLEELLSLHNLN